MATILAALEHRDRTGEAQRVDLSMMESVAAVVGDALVQYDATGRKPRPLGNHHPRIAPHNAYRAKGDDWLTLAAETESAWGALKAVVGDARLDGPHFADAGQRKENEEELDSILGPWCAEQDAAAAETVLNNAGVCAARVVPLAEIYSRPDPHFAATGFVAKIDHPEAGPTWLPGRPWRYSAAPSEPIRPRAMRRRAQSRGVRPGTRLDRRRIRSLGGRRHHGDARRDGDRHEQVMVS